MKGDGILTGITSVSSTHTTQLKKHCPEFSSSIKDENNPHNHPLAIIHHRKSLLTPRPFQEWANHDAVRHSWLGSLMRRKIQRKKGGGEGEKSQCISSAGPPCSFRVTLHETTEQRGCIQLIKHNKLQVSADRPTQRQTSPAVSDLRDSATIPEQNWAWVTGQSTSLTHSPSNIRKHMCDSENS